MVRLKTFTDCNIDPNSIPDSDNHASIEPDEDTVESWELFEGPRFRFGLLLGESPIWGGPPPAHTGDQLGDCPFCRRPVMSTRIRARLQDGSQLDVRTLRPAVTPARALPGHVYCLGCDRSGRDSEIRMAGAKPDKVRRVYAPAPGLKGGVG